MKEISELLELIELEQLEDCLFRGNNAFMGSPHVFGGQVLSQALHAATQTVPEDRSAHSLHAYFLLPGDLSRPIVYEVDTIRDGRSFTTRRIIAIQKGKAIFNMAVSYQLRQEGYEHQEQMPDVPFPDDLPSTEEVMEDYKKDWPDFVTQLLSIQRPLEFKLVRPYNILNPGKLDPVQYVWLRSKGSLDDDLRKHKSIFAYASDYNLLATALLPNGDKANMFNMQLASLDHALWFHRDFRIDDWLLYAITSPNAAAARGFSRGSVFSKDGKLVASVAQEGLMRKRRV